jgi:hypothetical protein
VVVHGTGRARQDDVGQSGPGDKVVADGLTDAGVVVAEVWVDE